MSEKAVEQVRELIQEGLKDYSFKYDAKKFRDLIKEQTYVLLDQFASMSDLLEVPLIECRKHKDKIILNLKAENEAQQRMISLLNSQITFEVGATDEENSEEE